MILARRAAAPLLSRGGLGSAAYLILAAVAAIVIAFGVTWASMGRPPRRRRGWTWA